jgi:hypothetical protein
LTYFPPKPFVQFMPPGTKYFELSPTANYNMKDGIDIRLRPADE